MRKTYKKHHTKKKDTRRKKKGGVLDQATFETCTKNDDNQVTCALTLDTLTRENAIMLPSVNNNKQCFDRDAVLAMFKNNNFSHPITRERIPIDWVLQNYRKEFFYNPTTRRLEDPPSINVLAERTRKYISNERFVIEQGKGIENVQAMISAEVSANKEFSNSTQYRKMLRDLQGYQDYYHSMKRKQDIAKTYILALLSYYENPKVIESLSDSDKDMVDSVSQEIIASFEENAEAPSGSKKRKRQDGGALSSDDFNTCAKQDDQNNVTCPISFDTLTPEKSVKPPSTTNQCFDSDAFLQHLLHGNQTHPLTREPIDSDWILNTYPDEFVRDSYTQGAARPWTIEEYAEHVKMADNLVDALEFAVYEITEVRDIDENVQSRLYAHHKNLNEALGLVMSEIDTHVHYYNRPKVYERILNDEDNAFDKLNDANDLLSFVREKRNRLYSNAYSPTPSIGGRTRRKRRKHKKRTRRHK
jgi:hypothetical protein